MTDKQISEAVKLVIANLTSPLTAEERKTGKFQPPEYPRIACSGLLGEIQDYFYEQGFTDGLPIIPPTEEKVAEMMKGTKHLPNEILTTSMPPERYVVTVEKVAINGVMAGCKPEHMPVLLSLIEAYMKRDIDAAVRSTNSFSFLAVINGPIRKELEMNAGTYAVGPGNRANSTIGRALRLFIINLGGGKPGVNMMAVIGNISTYSFCIPENEEDSPWAPFSIDMGFKPDESILSLFLGGWAHTGNYGHISISLDELAKDIVVFESPGGVVAMISPARAHLLKAQGMNKEAVKEHIWKNAALPLSEYKDGYFTGKAAQRRIQEKGLKPEDLDNPEGVFVPVYPRDEIHVVVVGGDASPMMQAWHMYSPQVVSIDKWR